MDRESIGNTIIVAVGLCLVCAAMVSITAVGLRDLQVTNKLEDRNRNILEAAQLINSRGRVIGSDGQPTDERANIKELFTARIDDRVIELESGEYVSDSLDVPVAEFDQLEAAESGDPEQRVEIETSQDIATLRTREKLSHVYVVRASATDDTALMYVFPIRGKGLWSILKGFIALDADLRTIRGLTYYEHGETPGLGGEVDNIDWKERWKGKLLFDEEGKVAVRLLKADWQDNPHAIDALSGATITSRGVEKMLEYWMGPSGFGPYLERLRQTTTTSERSTGATGG